MIALARPWSSILNESRVLTCGLVPTRLMARWPRRLRGLFHCGAAFYAIETQLLLDRFLKRVERLCRAWLQAGGS
jgi:hypothetical protein